MSLYEIAVPKFSRSLKAFKNILRTAEAHAKKQNIEESVLVNARLFPNMFPLKRQVQIAVDSARRGCGNLTGVDVPVIEDTEETFAELIGRIDTAIAYIDGFTPEQFEGAENIEIELPLSTGAMKLSGTDFLMGFAMANFRSTTQPPTTSFGTMASSLARWIILAHHKALLASMVNYFCP